MARADVPAERLGKIAEELKLIAERIGYVADSVKKAGLPHLAIHADTALDTYIPYLSAWSIKVKNDCEVRIEEKKHDRASSAERDRARAEKAKKLAK